MKPTHRLLAGLVCASPLLLALNLSADKVSFTPAEGTVLNKTFKLGMALELDSMSMTMNGEEMPMEFEMNMDMNQQVTTKDTYTKMEGSKPLKLSREFKGATMEMDGEVKVNAMGNNQNESLKGSGTSKLTGETVTFTWDADAGAYTTKFDEESDADVALLEGLTEDMDLRGLLPKDEVSEGDEWSVDNKVLIDLFAAGGDMHWNTELENAQAGVGGPSPEMMGDMRKMFGDMLDGDINCKYVGKKEVDGTKYLDIEVKVKINAKADLTDFVEEQMAGEEMPAGVEVSVDKMEMESNIEGKGHLLWDGAAGHMFRFEYEGEMSMALITAMNISAGGMEMTNGMEMEMSGTMTFEITTSK